MKTEDRRQKAEDRGQKTDRLVCLLSSVLCLLMRGAEASAITAQGVFGVEVGGVGEGDEPPEEFA
jgi:hypothetical protein